MKHLIICMLILFVLTGCSSIQDSPSIQTTPSTEVLDLSLVDKYEFTVSSHDDYSETIISIENPQDIQIMNEFLGQTVTITHSEIPCDCEYLDSVKIFLNDGKKLFFGIERNFDDSFAFSEYSLSVIRFEDKSYDDLMNLIERFRD